MKIIYFLKNLKLNESIDRFIKNKIEKVKKFFKKEKIEEGIVEVELKKDKETIEKRGLYKIKIILDLPKRGYYIAQSIHKNIFGAINNSFKKLYRLIKKK